MKDAMSTCQTNHPLPKGRRPNHIKQAMADNPGLPAFMFQCEGCGRWYSQLDRFIPYSFEMCGCKKCQAESS
jgi:hypothetical protein